VRADGIALARPRGLALGAGAALLLALSAGPIAAPAAAAPKPKLKLSIETKTQRQLLRTGALEVRVKTNRSLNVRLRAGERKRSGSARFGDFKRKAIRVRGGRAKTARLRLTAGGRRHLEDCGAQRVVVVGKTHTRRSALSTGVPGRLEADRKCLHVDVEAPKRCDPIDAANCMVPFPNDHFTVRDPDTETGRRVDFHPASMPDNRDGVALRPAEYNRNDGFSPNSTILTRIPGIQTQAAFDANGIVPQDDIGEYARPDQPLVLVNAATGERHPIWAELDEIPEEDGGRLLIAHPAEALEYGARYIVALRNLTDAEGDPLEPNRVFEAYRDGVETDNRVVEARRQKMEQIFETLEEAGIARDELHLAWDFTVASEQNLTGRLLAIRDDAFAQLGDTNLADGAVQGEAPLVEGLQVTNYELCDADANPACGPNQSNYALRKITGTFEVPCYMDPPGPGSGVLNPFPCGPGSRLHYEGGSEVPTQNGDITFDAPFTCVIPRAEAGSSEMGTDRQGIVFGHGLLGNNTAVEQLRLFPAATEGVACGTDWIGMSSSDLTGFLPQLLVDLGKFPALPDRSQQGMLNMLYLARAMSASAAQGGFAGMPQFQEGGESALASGEVGFLGISQGGIFGGAATSVAPDWTRAVLSVPGMGFNTLLTRSTQFNQFLPLVYGVYPDPLERQIGISMLQMLWDRGETGGYVHRLTDEPFANTPAHRVLLHEAFGDHQVANVQTETEARTIDAVVRTPILAPGRSLDAEPFWGIPPEPSSSFTQAGGYQGPAALFVLDTGPIRVEDYDDDGDEEVVGTNPNPISNVAPVDRIPGNLDPSAWNDGLDPHAPVATSPAAQEMIIAFLGEGGMVDPCVADSTPVPCTAPPIPTLGQGQ
jgi:hypothetical protein